MLLTFLWVALFVWLVIAFVVPMGQLALALYVIPVFLLNFFVFLRAGIHYSIHEEYLLMRFCWIPLRKIPWSRVKTATYLHKWMDIQYKLVLRGSSSASNFVYGQMIYITLDDCPDYCPMSQVRFGFTLHHLLTTCTLCIPYRQSSRVEELFAKYCDRFEKQPFVV
jgi:hypothetical protein